MDKKTAYADKQQAKLDEWTAEIKKLRAQAQSAEAEAKIKVQEKIDKAEAMQERFKSKLDELRSSGDDAWEEIKRGLDEATDSLGASLRAASSHFSSNSSQTTGASDANRPS